MLSSARLLRPSYRPGMAALAPLIACFLASSFAHAAPKKSRNGKESKEEKVVYPKRDIQFGKDAKPKLVEAISDALNQEAIGGADLTFLVTDLKGNMIAQSGPDTLINPASNAKLITAAAAFHYLKPEYRFKTRFYVDGKIKDNVLWGNLVVKGGGDPTLVTERVQRVANELYLFGIERITGRIIVDDSVFDHDYEAAGWEQEEAKDRAYAAPTGGLSFNYNSIGVYIRPEEIGEPATVRLDPPVQYAKLMGTVETKRWGRGLKIESDQDKNSALIEVTGAMSAKAPPRRFYRRIYDPALYFGSALVHFLQRRGVRVSHRVVHGKVPARAKLIYVDRSASLTKVVSDLNHYSNNFIAETLIKAIAVKVNEGSRPGTFREGLFAVRDFLEEEVGFEEGRYVFGNGSGLNDVNRLTARQIVQLLSYMNNDFETGLEYRASLAVAGTQGTIHHRMRDTPAQRRLRAKTGTLTGVSALSGYVVNPDNEVLLFSFLTQGYRGKVSPIWAVQNQIGEALASDGESFVTPEPELDEEKPIASNVNAKEPQMGGNP